MAPRGNLTGFDPRKLAAATGSPANDPWRRYEAWRYTGPFSRWNRFKGAFPGLGIGTAAFLVYVAAEAFFFPADKSHGHGESHH
ncbi:NADH-ubiquinone oxidoreductase B12 subunit family-domain-containing protein [Phyllosticta capitalensis]|uniref:NADH-ubiquinone oxidoreductase B12 subunit family-domain-containing protein n=1 Tax=Phyllosticta capitalensis TaxID=121624 RepID=A0ABR1Z3D0_9PEZI